LVYFFDSGTVAVGWKYIDKNWFYFNQNGELQTGLVDDGNSLYYIEKNTGMLTNTWKEINSKETYYFKENGKAAKDEWMDRYHFENDGILSKNKWIGIFHLNHSGRVSLTDYRNYLFIIFTLAIALIFLKLKKKYKDRIIKK
jgi:FOG: Glucan-binding domain (YG repeat)